MAGINPGLEHLREVHEQLVASERKYRNLFDAMSEGMAICEMIFDGVGAPSDFRYLEVNPAFERQTGLRGDEVVGRTVREILPGIEANWLEMYGRVVRSGEPGHLEAVVGDLNRVFDVSAYVSSPGHFAAVFHDVTTRRRMQASLRASEEWFRVLFTSTSDGIVIVGDDGLVSQMNPAARGLFALTDGVGVGIPFPYPFAASPQELRVAVIGGGERVVEMRVVEMVVRGRRHLQASFRDISELARLRDDLQRLTLIDPLTGVFNRRGLTTLGSKQLAQAQRARRGLWLLFADVNGMKDINDTLGHESGDGALIEFAEILAGALRKSDVVARIGGDEFAALVVETAGDGIDVVTRRLSATVEARNAMPGRRYHLSFSVGTACFDPESPCDLEELIRRADVAMYEQKRQWRASNFFRRPVPRAPN